jgi:hypothetical protein
MGRAKFIIGFTKFNSNVISVEYAKCSDIHQAQKMKMWMSEGTCLRNSRTCEVVNMMGILFGSVHSTVQHTTDCHQICALLAE